MAWPREGFCLWATGGRKIKECQEKLAAYNLLYSGRLYSQLPQGSLRFNLAAVLGSLTTPWNKSLS